MEYWEIRERPVVSDQPVGAANLLYVRNDRWRKEFVALVNKFRINRQPRFEFETGLGALLPQ
jgi:hypothetical protein